MNENRYDGFQETSFLNDGPQDDRPSEETSRPLLDSEALSDDRLGHKMPRTQFYIALSALMFGVMLYAADNILELAAFPKIGSELHQLKHVAWLTITYNVSVSTMQPLYSRLSDIYGRKNLLLASYIFFAVGIGLCAVDYNFWLLVVARLVVGAGSAGLGYIVSLILNDLISLRDRSTWQGVLQLVVFFGQFIGGTLGGFVVDRIGWRWAFAIELPVAIIGFSLVLLTVRLPPLPTQKIQVHQYGNREIRPQRKISFDVYGGMTLSIFVATFVFALSMGGNDLPWSHPIILTLASMSVVSFIGFVIVERQTSKAPLVPLRVIVQRSIWPLFTITFFKDMAFMTLLYLISLYNNVSGRRSTTVGGLLVTLIAIGTAIGNLIAGLYVRRFGRLKALLMISTIILSVVAILIPFRWNGTESIGEAGIEIFICGVCNGIIIGTLLVGLLKSVTSTEKAALYGALHLCTAIASLVALSIVTAIIQSRTRVYMEGALEEESVENVPEIVQSCIESLWCLETLPDHVQTAVRSSYIKGIRDGFTFVCANVLISLLFSLCAEDYEIGAGE